MIIIIIDNKLLYLVIYLIFKNDLLEFYKNL